MLNVQDLIPIGERLLHLFTTSFASRICSVHAKKINRRNYVLYFSARLKYIYRLSYLFSLIFSVIIMQYKSITQKFTQLGTYVQRIKTRIYAKRVCMYVCMHVFLDINSQSVTMAMIVAYYG